MLEQIKTETFDFFKKVEIDITKKSNKAQTNIGVFRGELKKIFTNGFSIYIAVCVLVFSTGVGLTINTINTINTNHKISEKNAKALELINNAIQATNNTIQAHELQSPENIKATPEIIDVNAVIKETQEKACNDAVDKLTQDEINRIVAYIDLQEKNEVNRLTKLYWTQVYINENEKPLKMDEISTKIQKQIFSVKAHYDSRKEDIAYNYSVIKNKQFALISDGLTSPMTIRWLNIEKVKEPIIQEESITLISELMGNLSKPENLSAYLEKNKKMIASSTIFE